jgi:FixJ family two-component response regulator
VLDLHMPSIDGFAVQSLLEGAGTPLSVVVITGYDSAEARERALAGGAVAYLPKPVDDEALLRAITRALALAPEDPPPA